MQCKVQEFEVVADGGGGVQRITGTGNGQETSREKLYVMRSERKIHTQQGLETLEP